MRKINTARNKPRPPPSAPQTPPPPPINYATQAMNNSNFGINQGGSSPMDVNTQSIPSLNEISSKITNAGSNFSIELDESLQSGRAYADEGEEVERADEEVYTTEQQNINIQSATSDVRPWEQEGYSSDPATAQFEAAQIQSNPDIDVPVESLPPQMQLDSMVHYTKDDATQQGVKYYKHEVTGAVLVDSANLRNTEKGRNEVEEWLNFQNQQDGPINGLSISSLKNEGEGIGTSNYGSSRLSEEGMIDRLAEQTQNRNEGIVKRQIMDDIGTQGFGYSNPSLSRTVPGELEQAKKVEVDRVKDSGFITSFTNTAYTKMGNKGTKDIFKLQPTTPLSTGVKTTQKGIKSGNLWLGNIPGGQTGTAPDLIDYYKTQLDGGNKPKGMKLNESFGAMNTGFLDEMKDRWSFKENKKQKVKEVKGQGGAGGLYDPLGFYKKKDKNANVNLFEDFG